MQTVQHGRPCRQGQACVTSETRSGPYCSCVMWSEGKACTPGTCCVLFRPASGFDLDRWQRTATRGDGEVLYMSARCWHKELRTGFQTCPQIELFISVRRSEHEMIAPGLYWGLFVRYFAHLSCRLRVSSRGRDLVVINSDETGTKGSVGIAEYSFHKGTLLTSQVWRQ